MNSFFDALSPGKCRSARTLQPISGDLAGELDEIDAMIASNLSQSFAELDEEYSFARSVQQFPDSSSETGSSSHTSVVFDCDNSAREREGIEVLGLARFEVFERMTSANINDEGIAAALDIPSSEIANLRTHLRAASDIKFRQTLKRATKVRSVIKIKTKITPTEDNPQQILLGNSSRFETIRANVSEKISEVIGTVSSSTSSFLDYCSTGLKPDHRSGGLCASAFAVLSMLILSLFCLFNSHSSFQAAVAAPTVRHVEDSSEYQDLPRARPIMSRPVHSPDSNLYYGFCDDGSEFFVRPPEVGDIKREVIMLEGLDSHAVVAHHTEDEEVSCTRESLYMVPEGTIQVKLKFKVDGEGETKTFSKGDEKFVARWKDGHFWLNRNDTEELRHKLTCYWKARRGKAAPTEREQRESYLCFDHLRADFDKNQSWVHNFSKKMFKCGVSKADLLHCWDQSMTVKYYVYLARRKLQELTRPVAPEEETTTGGYPRCVTFSTRPVRHACLEIPISHHFTHRPKLAGCAGCEQGKAELTPIVRTKEEAGDQGVEGSRLRIDVDCVGKPFPIGTDGSRIGLAMQSDGGHYWLIPMKNKEGETIENTAITAFTRAGIELKKIDLYGDEEFKVLGKRIEKEEGTYNQGIPNRSNSHARAENAVKNGLGAMRATSLTNASPAKDWCSQARALSVNISRESGNKYLGLYVGPLFAPGECSYLKLEPNVYTPPVHRPAAVKVQFMFYNDNSTHGIIIEFFDEHLQKRRRTEISSTAFEKGLPSDRPHYGYRRVEDEKEPLATYILGILSDLEKPIEVPKPRQLKEYEKANPKRRAAAKAGPKAGPKAAAKARGVSNKSFSEIFEQKMDLEAEVDYYQGLDYLASQDAWEQNYLESNFHKYERYVDLGQTDEQDTEPDRHPMEVSVGESARLATFVRPGRSSVKLVKVLKPREIAQAPYNELDWPKAYGREQDKMFVKFGCFGVEEGDIVEMDDLEEGSQLIRNFGVHTVKDYDHRPDWAAGYRLVGGGNFVHELKNGVWVRIGTVVDRQKDAIESATMESTRAFVHCQKIRGRKVRKKDADGAYLQAPPDTSRRPGGIWAELPVVMWPPGCAAFKMRRPVFKTKTSLYGVDDAGFAWDRFSHNQLESKDFHVYHDLSQSLYDHFPNGTDTSILLQEKEIEPYEYPVDDGSLSQYVDDFLGAEDEGSGVHKLMLSALRFKESEEDDNEPGDIGRFVGQTWKGVNDPPDAEGVYRYSAEQTKYCDTFLTSAEESLLKLGQKPLKHADTPALAHDHKQNTPELDETPGVLAPIAPSVVCALLYMARQTRLDTLFAVCRLTRYLTKWMVRQDQWLIRLLCYLKATAHYKLNFQICPEDFLDGGDGEFENWSDADLGGDKPTGKSTSGGLGLLKGSKTRALVHAHCKRQGSTALSTPDSETVAMVVLGKKTIPLHMIIQRQLKRSVKLSYKGDNNASERVIGTGLSAALAYMKRTADLSLRWAKENMAKFLKRTPTDENLSDIFTKPLDKAKFDEFRIAMGIY